MNVYLAAAFERQEEIQQYALELKGNGIHVPCSWLFEREQEAPEEFWAERAKMDLWEIETSDAFVLFNRGNTRHSRLVEFGYALAYCPLILSIDENGSGPPTLFHRHPKVNHVLTWEGARYALHQALRAPSSKDRTTNPR